jgi:glutathione synthase/RimK-type ligase-like ATP-grasp enzyme
MLIARKILRWPNSFCAIWQSCRDPEPQGIEMTVQLLGVYRERRFSPGVHAAGDAAILELTQAALERAGYQTALIAPECLSAQSPAARVVFAMCQSLEALTVLQRWEQQGILVLNTPAAVRACYRLALVAALHKAALPCPRSVVIPLVEAAVTPSWPPFPDHPEGCWIKRGDVHAMQPDDVVFVDHAAAWQQHLARFADRGIRHAVVQQHLPGQEVKFYAVRGRGVLHCFAPHDTGPPQVDPVRLNALALQAGEVLGLDIYGGDCILTPSGALYLVDVNDWPSFRGCRELAAQHIARYILTQAHRRRLLAPLRGRSESSSFL